MRGGSYVLVERKQYGKYSVVDKIGQGAMGEVFKALDPVLNRHVALKTIASSLESNTDARQRFHREAQSIARLNHPNIVTVYDFGEEKGVVYMAMELLDGSDLRNLIAANRLTDLDAKLAVMEQVCTGVGYAHSHSIVHRDLKPANIQVLSSGHVKVMDFGLARIGAASGMTATGAVLGTPHYMSPEQVKGEKADPRSDIFALGAILYQLLTGRQPFDAESVHAVLFKILEGDPEPVERWIDDVPAEVAGLAVRALAKDPQVRFADGAEMASAVSTVRSSLPGGKLSSDPQTLATLLATEAQGETHLLPTASQGALALDALIDSGAIGEEETHQPVPTLSGKAPTGAGPGRRSQASASASASASSGGGWVRAAAIAVGVVGALGLVGWGLFRPGPEATPAASETSGPSAIEQQLLQAQRQLAQQSLQDRDYAEAVAHAERALAVVSDDPEALRVRQAARQELDSADAAASAARQALEQGDNDTAGRRLTELLEIQPEHSAVAKLTSQLNDSFRPQAEEARTAMSRAESEARRLGASGDAVAHAKTLSREGSSAFSRSEYAVAAERFTTARGAFARAGRAAAARAAAEADAAEAARIASADATRARAAEEEAARVRAARETAARARAAEEAEALARARQPTPVPAAPPRAQAARPPPSAPAGPSDDELIRSLVADYERAIESQDLALFRRVKPNLSGDEESRLKGAFQGGRHDVNISVADVSVKGPTARVRVVRRDTMNGDSLPPINQVLTLRKGPGGWVVETIGR